MKIASVVFGALAALGFVSATSVVMLGKNRPAEVENLVGYVVGAYLLPVVLLIVSIALLQRSQKTPKP